jgi:hypothetical protein
MFGILFSLAVASAVIGFVAGLFVPFDVYAWMRDEQPHDLGDSWSTLEPFLQDEALERSWNGLGRSWKGPLVPYDWEKDL